MQHACLVSTCALSLFLWASGSVMAETNPTQTKPLLVEDFGDPDLSGWTFSGSGGNNQHGSGWSPQDGVLQRQPTGGWGAFQFGNEDWDIGAIEFRFRLLEPDKNSADSMLSLLYRGVNVRVHGFVVQRIDWLSDEIYAKDKTKGSGFKDLPLEPNRWYHLKVTCEEAAAQVFLDDELVLTTGPIQTARKDRPQIHAYLMSVTIKDLKVWPPASRRQAQFRAYNFVYNSSFEHATNEGLPDGWSDFYHWGLVDEKWLNAETYRQWHEKWRQDDQMAYDGKKSLRVSFPLNLQAVSVGVLSGDAYTVSAYLRSNQDGLPVRFGVTEDRIESPIHAQECLVNTKWERYTLTAPSIKESSLKPFFAPVREGTVWVDAVQVEKGEKASPYQPYPGDSVFRRKETPPPPPPRQDAIPELKTTRSAPSPPKVDGKPHDVAWGKAPFVGLFQLGGAAPAQKTEARVCFDDQRVYILFKCFDTEVNLIRGGAYPHDDGRVFGDDSIELFIDPAGDAATYHHFAVNTAGATYDAEKYDSKWNGVWQAKTSRCEDCWIVELAIPFSTLQAASPVEEWRMNFCRNHPRSSQNLSWAPTLHGYHDPQHFGFVMFGEHVVARHACKLKDVALVAPKPSESAHTITGRLENNGDKEMAVAVEMTIGRGEKTPFSHSQQVRLKPRRSTQIEVPGVDLGTRRMVRIKTTLREAVCQRVLSVAEHPLAVPRLLEVLLERSYYTTEPEAQLLIAVGSTGKKQKAAKLQIEMGETFKTTLAAEQTSQPLRLPIPLSKTPVGDHPVTATLADAQGNVVARAAAPLRKLPPSASTEVKVDHVRKMILVGGQPVFPFGIFRLGVFKQEAPLQYLAQCGFKSYCQAGSLWSTPSEIKDCLQKAHRNGLSVLMFIAQHQEEKNRGVTRQTVAALKDERAVIGWIPADESLMEKDFLVDEFVAEAKEMDPYRVVYPNHHTASFEGFRNRPKGLVGDIVSVDRYPIYPAYPPTPQDIYSVEDALDAMAEEAEALRQPMFMFLQTGGHGLGTLREPTPREEEFMTYISVIKGARGIYYYNDLPRCVALWEKVLQLNREIQDLLPVLSSTEEAPSLPAASPSIRHALKKHERDFYLISVNRSTRAERATFDLSKLRVAKKSKVEVLFENRTIPVTGNGEFNDSYEGFQRHVYKISL